MKAVVCTKYGPPEVLQLQEVKTPIPKDHEVRIKIYATAVTPSECMVRGLKLPARYRLLMRLLFGFTKPRQPIFGLLLAGEVESIGKKVTLFKNGDKIFGWTGFRGRCYAEYKCMPEKGLLTLKPSNLNYEEAAAILYGGFIALHFLKKAKLQRGEKVLIYGASGANGTAAVQLAKYFGAHVTGVCSTPNLELVKSLGADAVLDYTKEDFLNRGEHYDLIFDAVGKRKFKRSKSDCEKALTPNGRSISVDDGMPKCRMDGLVFLKEQVEKGNIKAVIDRCYSMQEIVEAHRYVDQGHKKGNVIITVAK